MSKHSISRGHEFYLRRFAAPALSILADLTSSGNHYNEKGLERMLADERPHIYFWTHSDIAMDHMLMTLPIIRNGGEIPRFVADEKLKVRGTHWLFSKHGVIYISRKGNLRKTYKQLNGYLEEGVPIGIAEQGGRSKDGVRYTDPCIVGYFVVTSKMDAAEFSRRYALTPVAVSYEWKPDAERMSRQLLHGKQHRDDLWSTLNGIFGHKGRTYVCYGDAVEGDDARSISKGIDEQNWRNLAIWPSTLMAFAERSGSALLKYEALHAMTGREQQRAFEYCARVKAIKPELQNNVHSLHAGPIRDEESFERAISAAHSNNKSYPVFVR